MDIVVVLIVLAILPFVLARPYVGAVLYTALAYLRPQNMVGGLALSMRLSLLVLGCMAVGFAIAVFRGKEKPVLKIPFFALLGALLAAMFVSTQTAIFPDLARSAFMSFLQLMAGVAFTIMLCNTPGRLRAVLATIGISLGAMAIVSLIDPTWDNGRLSGAGGKFRDSNDFALALTMALPLLVYLRRSENKGWLKLLLTIPIPFVLTAIVLTYSRGGFLALSAVGICWVLFSRGRVVRLALAPIAALLFVALAPPKYLERITTIESYEHDGASRDRLSSWNVATKIAVERPFTGVGPGNFLPVYRRYATDLRTPHVAHNAFLQILAESGVFTLAFFLAIVAVAIIPAAKVAKRARAFRSRLLREGDENRAKARRLSWIDDCAQGIVLSLIAFLVGAQFLSRDDLDLLYLLAGLSGVLVMVAKAELAAEGYLRPDSQKWAVPVLTARPVVRREPGTSLQTI